MVGDLSVHRARNILTKEQVVDIFLMKHGMMLCDDAASVGRKFGVSEKTIRDIWVARTWYKATLALDPCRSDANDRLKKKIGRPRGTKDSKPRTYKSKALEENLQACAFRPMAARCKSTALLKQSDGLAQQADRYTNSTIQDEMPFGNMIVSDFTDPFHNDWPYWTSETYQTGAI